MNDRREKPECVGECRAIPLPEGIFVQHIVVLGKTGSGKSSVLRLCVERLLDEAKPVCIVDPKGDWFGLRSMADGCRRGYPVVIFGGDHADIPLNPQAGLAVGELVGTGNRPCIIDLGGWMMGERTRFFIDFASALFRSAKGRRYLIIDEVHNFAPQGKVLDVDAGKMLHWSNRLASEGRSKGLTILAASQRPQKVHKDFLTCAETLIAMRVIHPLDRAAIKDWIDGCADPSVGKEVLGSLASLKRGEGWVWSPEIGYGPKQVRFPMFKTYDSFRPRAEAIGKLPGWAEVDLDALKAQFGKAIEETRANDPKLLRAELVRLQAEVRRLSAAQRTIETPVLKDGQLARVEKLVERAQALLNGHFSALTAELAKLREAIAPAVCRSSPTSAHKAGVASASGPIQQASQSPPIRQEALRQSGLRRILTALAQRPGLTNRQLGVRAGLSSRSGTFATYLSKARAQGWIRDEGDRRYLTPAGLVALGDYEPLPEGRDLLAYWMRTLGQGGAGRMLQALSEAYPNSLSREQLGAAAGISPQSGTFATYLSRLRGLELVEGDRGSIRLSAELYGDESQEDR